MINFFDFFKHDFAVNGIIPIYQYYESNMQITVHNRVNNGLVFFTDCSAEYTFNTINGKETLFVPQNSIVLLTKNSSYTVRFIDSKGSMSDKKVSDYLINFDLIGNEFDEKIPCIVLDKISSTISFNLNDVFSIDSAIHRLTLNATFYSLLDNLFVKNKTSDVLLKPALDYINSNPKFDKINVNVLADLCNMHISTFRRHFKNMFGMSPSQFVKNDFIKRANYYLITKQYSIKTVSGILGFENVSYFSRFYKDNTGYMPSEVKKL